ncbi:MAG: ribonuclease Z [Syntrophobacteraceae bacterium]
MECVLIGTGGMMPMPYRMPASMAVRLGGRIYLFDAGEGTQINWKRLRLGVRGLDLIAATHLHADHCLGIPGLMMLRAQMDDPPPLTILGPPGIREFVCRNQSILEFHLNYPICFIEWSDNHPELAYEDELVRIFWQPLQHTRFCLGYRLEELDRPGKFHKEKAKNLRVPPGPLWGKLQHGENVTNDRGEQIRPEQVLGPPRRGRRIAYVVDTRPIKSIYRLCKDVDLAFMEGMFLPEDAEHADAKGHMTVVEASRIARRANVRKAVLTHLSPRYHNEDVPRLESAALEQFEHVKVGKDLETFQVQFEE